MLKSFEEQDAEIRKLLESLYAQKRTRNAASRINRLPPEILCAIFEQYQELRDEDDDSDSDSPDYRRWTPAHVCHYWRQLALGDPGFWRRMTVSKLTSHDCLEEQLRRAGTMPLIVDVRTHPHRAPRGDRFVEEEKWKPILDRVLRELSRIQALRVTYSDDSLVAYVVSALNVDTPVLSELSLVFDGRDSEQSAQRAYLPRLPNAPRLSIVELGLPQHHSLRCAPLFKPSLKELHVAQCTTPKHGDLQTALSRLPYLETLRIFVHREDRRFDAEDSDEESEDQEAKWFVERPTSMPRLRAVHLEGTVSDCTLLLNSLSLPKYCAVNTTCLNTRGSDATYLGSALAAKGWGDHQGADSSFDIMVDSEGDSVSEAVFKLSAWHGDGKDLNLLERMDHCRGMLTVALHTDPWPTRTFFHFSGLLHQTRRLILGRTIPLMKRFSLMDNVEEISLKPGERFPPHTLLAALQKRVRQQSPSLLFPKLRVIYLPSVTFDAEWTPITDMFNDIEETAEDYWSSEGPVSISVKSLIAALEMRKKDGIPVSSLVLTSPVGLELWDLRTLCRIVDIVTIDGKIIDLPRIADSS